MPLAQATISYDLSSLDGAALNGRRTKVWATTNVPGDAVIDADGNKVRLGSAVGSHPDAGPAVGSLQVWIPGAGSNPASWQTYIHVVYPDRYVGGDKNPSRTFGPFTITASANLADLVPEQEVPPVYLTQVTQQLDAKVTEAETAATSAAASAQQATDLVTSDLGTTDGQTKALIQDPASQTATALSATFAPLSVQTTVETGRLADASLNTKYAARILPSGVGGRTGTYDPQYAIYTPLNASLRKISAKMATVAGGVANSRAKILWVGHSEAAGYGGVIGTSDAITQLRKRLAERYPVGSGVVMVVNGVNNNALAGVDPRWTLAASWVVSGGAAGAGNLQYFRSTTTSGATATFASNVAGTIVDIVTFGNSAAMTYSIDGGAAVALPLSGASAQQTISISGLANTTHTVTLTTTSTGTAYLVGAGVRPASAVEVSNLGYMGAWAKDLKPAVGGTFFKGYEQIAPYAPTLVIVQYDANEAINAQSATTVFKPNMQDILTPLKAAGYDLALVSSMQPGGVSDAAWDAYRTVSYDLADQYAAPLLDMTALVGYKVSGQALGLYDADNTHPNAAGYATTATAMRALLP